MWIRLPPLAEGAAVWISEEFGGDSKSCEAPPLECKDHMHWVQCGAYLPTCLDFLSSLNLTPSDMLLLWACPLLALLCLLSTSALLHQHAHHVHHLPCPELRCLLPHAVPHRLRARPGKCEFPEHFLITGWKTEFATASGAMSHVFDSAPQFLVTFFCWPLWLWISVCDLFGLNDKMAIEGTAAAPTVSFNCDLKVASVESSQPRP